jgi:hypothetical protein
LDQEGPRFTVPDRVRQLAAGGDRQLWYRHHALAVADLFDAQIVSDLTTFWPELQHAFAAALAGDWALACRLARRAVGWARAYNRLAEAFEILQEWSRRAEQLGDRRVLEDCAWEQIWILEHWGRTNEARELDGVRRRKYADQMSFEFA